MKKFAICFLLCTVFAWGCSLFAQEPFRISRETTYITEPLNAEGTMVDYFAAIEQRAYPPEMQTDDNGYRIVFRALGDFNNESPDPAQLRQRYEKLGLDPDRDKPTLPYLSPAVFVKKRFEEESGSTHALIAAMKFHEHQAAQDWLTENGPALDLVAEAVQKPVFVFPCVQSDTDQELVISEMPDISALHEIARGLECRSRIRVAMGDLDGAVDDVVACYRLGRHAENMPTLIDGLVGISFETMANSVPLNGNVDVLIDEKGIRRLLAALSDLPPQKGFVHKLETERFYALHWAADSMKKNTMPGSSGTRGRNNQRAGVDWNIVFELVNDAYDEAMLGNEVEVDAQTNLGSFLTRQRRSEQMAKIVIALMLPATQAVVNVYDRCECTTNIRRIVLAMLLYEREHGTLPPTFTVDENGEPLHGWRTLLLPYFGDETLTELYSRIRLDEPWDSEHNRQFHDADVAVYRCPAVESENGQANYAFVTGEGSPTWLIIERPAAAPWMRPDLQPTPKTDPTKTNHVGGLNIGFANGAVRFLNERETGELFEKAR